MDYDHKQVETKFGFFVDEEIKDLIELLNDNAFYTNNSCQEQEHCNHETWICFNENIANKFMKKIFKLDLILYDYLSYCEWDIIFDLDHLNKGKSVTSLRFPYKDLDHVTTRLKRIFSLKEQKN